jgi:hypothetical protein
MGAFLFLRHRIAVMIGCQVYITPGEFDRFIQMRKVAPSPNETKGQDCVKER